MLRPLCRYSPNPGRRDNREIERRRRPGYYVAVRATALAGPDAPELLDGPWASPEAARERGAEVEASDPRARWRVVLVGSDGAVRDA